jgi:hypothetical protein
MNTAVSKVSEAAVNIDRISTAAMEAFSNAESFVKELKVAQAVVDLRLALTEEIMAPIMALMNTSLGFKTDQDPARPSQNNPQPTAYSLEVVRNVFIESRLRGFHCVGNEFNIIAGNFYGTLAGFERQVKQHKNTQGERDVTDVKDFYEVPRMAGDGRGAIVKCRCDWRQDATPQFLEREFAVRVNAGMGADAITGKAKRKLFAAVHGRLTGVVTPEGDTADTAPIEVKATVVETAAGLFGANKKADAAPADNVPMDSKTPFAKEAGVITAQQRLATICGEAGVKFDDFRDFVTTKNLSKVADTWTSFDEVPESVCAALQTLPKTTAEMIKKFGTVKT